MKAWKLIKKNQFELISRELSEMDEKHDVKIKMNRVMITPMDCTLMSNPNGNQLILGNIGIGIVSEVLESCNSRLERMERVVIEPFIACQDCNFCKHSKEQNCTNKSNLGINTDGLLRDFICLPHNCLYSIPDVINTNDAILIPHISLALNLLDKIELKKGEHVAIFGGGILGVIVACLVNYYQAMPVLVETNTDILKTANQKNIFYTFDYDKDKEEEVAQKIFSLTGGRKCEKVIYLSNESIPVSLALNSCSPNGIFSVYNTYLAQLNLPLDYVIKNNLTVNTVENCYGNFPTAINLLTKDVLKASDFNSQQLSFGDLDQTLPKLTTEQTILCNHIVKFD